MPLKRLYNTTTGSGNPSYLTGVLPGGAGAQTAGTSANPMISAPRIEETALEVFDVTAPTLIGTNTPGTPAPAGKLLVIDPPNSIGGAKWKLNSTKNQAVPGGLFGIVFTPGQAAETGACVSSSSGNISQGSKAVVVVEGPVNALVTSVVNTTAISAGMQLAADGAGNLTYAGASPAAGTVLAIALGPVASNVSTPATIPVYVGGY